MCRRSYRNTTWGREVKTANILLAGAILGVSTAAFAAVPASAIGRPVSDAKLAFIAKSAASAVAKATEGESATATTPVAAPTKLSEGITLDAASAVKVRMDSEATRSIVDGRAVYVEADGQTTSVVQPFEDSTQILKVIHSADAPREYAFDFELAAGATLVPLADGSIDIVEAGESVGRIDPAWALDANGVEVATHYRIDGNKVTQVVEHVGAAYPVTADPRVTLGRYIYVTFNRSETTRIAAKSNYANVVVSAACTVIPHTLAKAGCVVIAGGSVTHVSNTFKAAAAKSKKCAQMRFFLYPPFPIGGFAGASVVKC